MYGIRLHPAKDREGTKINLAVANTGILVFQVRATRDMILYFIKQRDFWQQEEFRSSAMSTSIQLGKCRNFQNFSKNDLKPVIAALGPSLPGTPTLGECTV